MTRSMPRPLGLVPAAALAVAVALFAQAASAQATKRPSNLVHLHGQVGFSGSPTDLERVLPDASRTAFAVPADRVFVLTSITLAPFSPGTGIAGTLQAFTLFQRSGPSDPPAIRLQFDVPSTEITHLPFPAGLVFGAGSELEADVSGLPGGHMIEVSGYLAPDV